MWIRHCNPGQESRWNPNLLTETLGLAHLFNLNRDYDSTKFCARSMLEFAVPNGVLDPKYLVLSYLVIVS